VAFWRSFFFLSLRSLLLVDRTNLLVLKIALVAAFLSKVAAFLEAMAAVWVEVLVFLLECSSATTAAAALTAA